MLFYKARHRTEKESDKLLRKIIITGVIFAAAIVFYSATVFAWFQAGISNNGNMIKAAQFSVSVSVKNEADEPVWPDSDGSYQLKDNTAYSITLTGDGNAKNGYCKISGGKVTLYTANIQEQENRSMTFSYVPENSGAYTFTACWGTAPQDSGELVAEGSNIGEKTDSGNDGMSVGTPNDTADNTETGQNGSETGASGTDSETPADGENGSTGLFPAPDSGQNAGQSTEQDGSQDMQSGTNEIEADKQANVGDDDTADNDLTGDEAEVNGQSDSSAA